MNILVIGVAFSDIKGFPFGTYDPIGTNHGRVSITHGGVARNVAEDMAVLGATVRFPLMLGTDPIEIGIRQALELAGVDVSEAVRVKGTGSGLWLAVFNEKGELAGSVSQMPEVAPLEEMLREKGERLVSEADAVVVEFDTSPFIASCCCELAQKLNKPVYAIVGNMSVMLACPELVAKTRCAIMNEIEAGKLFDADICGMSDEDALDFVRRQGTQRGFRAIVVTRGPKGSIWADIENDFSGIVPRINCRVVDTTGAGDAFFSAAVLALTRGDSVQKACEKGALLASRVIQTEQSACPAECAGMFRSK